MTIKYNALVAAAALWLASPAIAETIDNATVIQLVRVGLGEDAVIAKIKGSAHKFDVGTDALIDLKGAGVPSSVITVMIEVSTASSVGSQVTEVSIDSPDPMVPHATGVYLLADWQAEPKMIAIDATTSNQTKTGGFLGYALTGGIASMSFKTVIPNNSARVDSMAPRPKFYFYFDQSDSSLSGGAREAFWMAGAVTSPAEFSLVRFSVKKDRREAKVGQFNITGAKSGVMEKDQIPFDYKRLAPGVFEVVPQLEMEPGEYGFIYSSSTGGGPGAAGVGSMTSRIFDFSIQP